MNEISSTSNQSTLLTVRQFSEKHPAFSQGSLRNLIFNSNTRKATNGDIPGNGLEDAGAIIRIGRKILIVEDKFFAWVRSLQEGQGA